MGKRLGIIALEGNCPHYVLENVSKKNIQPVSIGIRKVTDPELESKVSELKWFDLNEVFQIVSYLQKAGVKNVLFAGKINPAWKYDQSFRSQEASEFFGKLKDQRPSFMIKEIINFFETQGFIVDDPRPFLERFFCSPGLFTKRDLTEREKQDLDFALPLARKIADMDIGQTIVVKDKTVVAVEGVEGTDEVIKRGVLLAGKGIVIVKVGRSKQDFRIDMPVVGLNTVKSLIESGTGSLCFEADNVPFFQQEEAITLADSRGITIKAVAMND